VSIVGIGATAGLEELSSERRRYVGAVVHDVDAYAAGRAVRANGDDGLGVAAGVVEERADDAFEKGGWYSGHEVWSGRCDRQVARCVRDFGQAAQYRQDLGRARRGSGRRCGGGSASSRVRR
jgi:hypothetical protein